MRASDGGEIVWTQTESLNTIGVQGYSETNEPQHPYDVAVDASGVYVVGDEWWNSSSFGWRIEKRSLTDGSLIWAQTDEPWGSNTAYGVAVDGTGVYVAGYFYPSESRIEKRSLIDGSLIWNQTAKLGQEARDVAVDASGVYVVGVDLVFGCTEWGIEKLNREDGSIIWNTTSAPPSPSCYRQAWGIASDGTGLYVVGLDDAQGPYNDEWRIEKRSLIDGSLIWNQTSNPTNFYDAARGVAADSSGVYVVGVTQPGGDGREVSRIEKRSPLDGTLVWATTGNYSLTNFGVEPWAVGVDGHAVYTIGSEYSSSGHLGWKMEKRSLTDGSLIWTAWENPSGIHDRGYAVAIDSTGVYFAGSEHIHGYPGIQNYQWRIEKRNPIGNTATTSTLASVGGFPEWNVAMVVGDLALNPHGSKPSGVGYQQGRDTTPLGYLRGMLDNTQPDMFDTNAAVNSTTGRPIGSWPLIFSIGGPGINAVTDYYETTSNVSDRAPIMFGYNSTYFYWSFTKNGTKVPGSSILQSSTAVPPGTSDVFVIQILRDADGRLVVLMYGTRYTGTWAAAEYFKFHIYPTIASWTDSYYIVQWTDATSGTSANFMPDAGDTFTILAQGTP